MTLEITTIHPEELRKAYIAQYRHGLTMLHGEGGYSGHPLTMIHTVVSSYEVQDIQHGFKCFSVRGSRG